MKTKVLLVDDSSLARRTLRLLLEEIGHEVSEASSGPQALERYFLDRPGLVILDMVMTGMYGLEVLEKMREMDPEVRVIVATADVQKSTADQVRAAGAKAIVNKPVSREALAGALKDALGEGVTWN